MNDILYIYDDEQNTYKPFNVLGQFGKVRQICKGFSSNSFQILSETGCLYYISYELSFYQLPFKNEKIKYITTNKNVTLALSYSGQVYSFGEDKNHYGTLGISKIYFLPIPSRIGADFKQVSLSSHLACGLDYSGKLWTWGQTPIGNSEIPYIVNPLSIKIQKICAGKDYILLIDGSSNIFLLSDSFKSSLYSNQKWVIQKFKQFTNEHLVISDILPHDHYSFLLTNKNELYLLVLDELVIKKLDIRLKIHNVTQNDTHLFCQTEFQEFIKIDKANLYQNEQIEMKALYEQIRYENKEKALHSVISPQNIIKFTLNSIQGFVVDRERFIDRTQKKGTSTAIQIYQQQYSIFEAHRQETQLKLSIINHQVNRTPTKVVLPQSKSRLYYSPQPIILKSNKSAITPLKQSAILPKSFLSRTQNIQQPLNRSFVNYTNSRTKSPVKKANLMRLLIQDVQLTINSMYTYPQIAFEFRERVYSNRSSSPQDIRQMIKEINPRANSSEKEKIQEFIYKERTYDQELNKQMETVRSQIEGLKRLSNQSEDAFEDATSKKRYSIADDLSVGEFGIQDKESNYVSSRILGSKKQFSNQQNVSTIIQSPRIQRFDETTKFFEEEILIRNSQKQDRVLLREIIFSDSSTYVNDENLYAARAKDQILIASRVINEGIDQSWELTSDNKYKKVISKNEPIQYLEEDIKIYEGNCIIRKQVRKIPEMLNIGEEINEEQQNGDIVESRRLVENNESLTQMKADGWNLENMQRTERNLGKQQIQIQLIENCQKVFVKKFSPEQMQKQEESNKNKEKYQEQKSDNVKFLEEELLSYNKDTGKIERMLIRKPFKEYSNEGYKQQNENGIKVLSRRIIDDSQTKQFMLKNGWQVTQDGLLKKIISESEPEQYVEEEILIYNPLTKKQDRKLVRRPLFDIQLQEISEELDEDGDLGLKIVARRIIKKEEKIQQGQEWLKNTEGNFELQIQSAESTQYVEEEILIQGQNGKIQRKLIRRPIEQCKGKVGNNLREVDKNGNIVISRQIIDKIDSFFDWKQIGKNFEKIISQEEPEQFVEEEIIIINPKTGKQERKLIRRPYENEEEIGDQLNESIGNNQKVVARRILKNDSSLSEWKKNQKTGQLEKFIVQNEPAKFIEEEILVMNEETGQMERKLVRKQYQPGLNVGNNLQENDSNGNKIFARRIIENTQSIQQIQKEGWKNNQGNYEKTLSIQEPTQFIEEEIIIVRQGGKQERKIIRRPLDDNENIKEGEQLLEDLGDGCYVVSRKIVDNDLSLASSKWKKNSDGNYQQSLGVEPSQYITEEVLQFNNETGMMERKLIRKPYLGGKIQEGDQLNEVDKNGNKVLSRKIESNLQPKAAKQQWQNVGKQEEIILNSEEPEQFIEEEIIQINPKTGKLERKIVRKPLNNEEIDNLQIGQNFEEDLGNGRQVISRKIVQNDQSNQALKQQGWVKNSDGNMEIRFQPEPVKYVEEEILVQGEDGIVQRKLVRRPYLPQDNKLQTGVVIEKDQNGNKVVSRKIVQNNKPIDSTWIQLNNGQLEKVVSQQEPVAYIEEEIIIINPKTQRQKRKLTRRPLNQSDVGEIGENLQEGDGTRKVVARRIISNEQSLNQMKDWQQKQGQMEIQLVQSEPTQYIEEEVLCYGENGLKRKLVRRPLTKENSQMGNNLNEVDKDGNRILSRKIVDNSQSLNQVQKDWQKGQNGTLEKIISQEEPEQFVEEEIIIINPKTGKQERILIRKPIFKIDEEINYGENLNEQGLDGIKLIARRIIQNQFSSDILRQQGWQQKQDGNFEQIVCEAEPSKYIEEEILVMNKETKQFDRKIIRLPLSPNNKNLKCGDNLQEIDSEGKQVLSRRIIDNDSPVQQQQKEGWKVEQGKLTRLVSFSEPDQFIEEEILIINKNTGKQERKLIRKPYIEDKQALFGDEIDEQQQGYKVISRKVVQNNISSEAKKKEGWITNKEGLIEKVIISSEPSKYIEEEILSFNKETGLLERKLIRRQIQENLVMGESIQEVDPLGNTILSRKIVDNNSSKGWVKQKNGTLVKQLSAQEPEQYVEEEVLLTDKDGQQQIIVERRPLIHGEGIIERTDGGFILSRKVVQNNQTLTALQQGGWVNGNKGILKKIGDQPTANTTLSQQLINQDSQYFEEEHQILNPETNEMEIILLKFPYNSNKQIGKRLKEQDPDGNQIISRRIVTTLDLDYNPYQYVEEIVEITNKKSGQTELFAIQKQVNITEVKINKNLNEKQPNGFIIKQRKVINQFQIDSLQSWKKLTDVPKEYFKQHQNINIKRSMYQIDEDSQEQRDSQYRANEELNSQGIRVSDFDGSKIDKIHANPSDKRKQLQSKTLEEEILIQNAVTKKIERRLQRKEMQIEQDLEIGEDLYEQDEEIVILSRQQVESLLPQDLMKKGWYEQNNKIWSRVLSKDESFLMIEEVIKEGKGNKQKIIITRKQYKDEEVAFGEDLSEQISQDQMLIRRSKVSNRSLIFFKNNDFIKSRDGYYVKVIQSNNNPNIQLKIPKYQEPNLKKSKSNCSQLSLIQALEQTQLTKSKSLMNDNESQNKTLGINKGQQQTNEQFLDDQAIINRTNISDISETDKMFLKQLERKDQSKKYSQQDILRNRVGSDKNNRSSSSPFSDQDYNMSPNFTVGIKILKRLLQKMIFEKIRIGFDELNFINQKYKRISKAFLLIKKYGTKYAFFCLNEHRLKNIIEFNEDDIIKYNQMLTENKIQAMEHIPEQGQQAEPIELSPDKKGSRILVQSQSQILPQQLNQKNSFTTTPQKEQQIQSSNQIKSGQPVRSAQAPSTSIIISTPPPNQQLARMSNSRSSTMKTVASPQPQQKKYQQQKQYLSPVQQKFSQQSDDQKKSGQDTSYSTQKSNRQLEVSLVNQSQNASQISIQNQKTQSQTVQQKEKISQQFKKMGSYSQKSKK